MCQVCFLNIFENVDDTTAAHSDIVWDTRQPDDVWMITVGTDRPFWFHHKGKPIDAKPLEVMHSN